MAAVRIVALRLTGADPAFMPSIYRYTKTLTAIDAVSPICARTLTGEVHVPM